MNSPRFTVFSPTDPAAYRDLASAWAASVTVVTVHRRSATVTDSAPALDAFTATAFLTVSADPPIVLVSASNSGNAASMLRDAHSFAVNFLSSTQLSLSEAFSVTHDQRDAGVNLSLAPVDHDGTPLIAGALGVFSARPRQFINAGDHTLVLGDVTALRIGTEPAQGLVYVRRAYGVVRSPLG